MFRRPATRLRQLASPLFKRAGTRARTGAEHTFKPEHIQRPFWNSGRVLLFSAVTGTTTYFYGVNDDPQRIQLPQLKSPGPQYASKVEMERAGLDIH
jgi:D-lactate dehydrogenase (cytochrome)